MHRLLIILGLSFALASCGGDDAEDDSSSRYLAPGSSNVVTASGTLDTPVNNVDVVIVGRPAA